VDRREVRGLAALLKLRVRLTPGANADRIDGGGSDEKGAYLKARVRAAPEQGKANAALQALLAKALGVSKSRVELVQGTTSRMKVVYVEGVTTADIARLFEPEQRT